LSKLLEKIAFLQLNSFIENNGLLSPVQFGFRKKRSIDSLILSLSSKWRSLLDMTPSPLIGIVSLDISKAFDNINHSILLHKLQHCFNLSSASSFWLSDYLSNRKIITVVNDCLSNPIIINRGDSQGGILSPLLFNLFINDLASLTINGSLSLYADDCLIYCSGANQVDLYSNLSSLIPHILAWYYKNDLNINSKKSKFLILSTTKLVNPPPLPLANSLIYPSRSLKYLGCTIDSHLNFSSYVSQLCAQASVQLNMMKTIFNFIKSEAKFYYCHFIRPLLEISPSILYSISKTDSQKIERVQNRALKLITGIKFNRPESINLSIIREKLNIPLLSSRRTVLFLGKVFKALHSFDPILNQSLQFAPPPNHRFLFRRSSFHAHTLLIPKYNKASYGCKSFDSLAATLWNSLPDFLRVCNSLEKFKSLAKILFLEF